MRTNTLIVPAMALGLLAGGAFAEPAAKPALPPPVPGGLSGHLAPLGQSLKRGSAEFRSELQSTLGRSRREAHEMIDEIIDSGNLDAWLQAMSRKDGDGFAESLRGKPEATVRAALHSRLDRKLAKLGKEIDGQLASHEAPAMRGAFNMALRDLSREEGNLLEAAASVGIDTARGSLDAEVDAAATDGEADGAAAGPAAPRASWDRERARRRRRRNAPRTVVVNNYYNQPGAVDGYAYRTAGNNRLSPAQQRTLNVAQQRLFFRQQVAAQTWNSQVNQFNRYLYGARQPRYSNPRYRRTGFPAGYYYRPDRVERVIRRGLWGAAAVASTPFALVASIF